jgi:hypothetical protein
MRRDQFPISPRHVKIPDHDFLPSNEMRVKFGIRSKNIHFLNHLVFCNLQAVVIFVLFESLNVQATVQMWFTHPS